MVAQEDECEGVLLTLRSSDVKTLFEKPIFVELTRLLAVVSVDPESCNAPMLKIGTMMLSLRQY